MIQGQRDRDELHNMIKRQGVKNILRELVTWCRHSANGIHESNGGLREAYYARAVALDRVVADHFE